ncbi:MAG: hypothetical protein LBE22_09375 [Azoarcus sp.]|nr:hypothetical protein [Azoarcus sp.]
MKNKRQHKLAVLAGGLVALLALQSPLAVAQEDGGAQGGGDAAQGDAGAQEGSTAREGAISLDEKSPISFTVSQSVLWHDNIFYFPDKEYLSPANQEKKRSDTLYITRASVNFDKQYSRQAFHAGLGVSQTWYGTHSDYNNTSPDANLGWDWRIGDRLSGVLGYSASQSFVGFDDTYTGVNTVEQDRVMRRLSRANASVDFWWHPNWATGFGFSDVRNSYSDDARPHDEYETQDMSLNVTYRPSTGNRLVLGYHVQDGQYSNRAKAPGSLRDWEQRSPRLTGQWRLSGVTQLNGYIGHTKRKYDLAPERNFSGVTGKIGIHWTPTGKAIIDLSWRREIGADADVISNFAVSQGWTVKPTWVISSKVRLGADYEYLKRDYRGDPGYILGGVSWENPKNAKTTSYGLNLEYSPVPYGNIALGYRHQERDTADERYGYRARIVSLTGRLTF